MSKRDLLIDKMYPAPAERLLNMGHTERFSVLCTLFMLLRLNPDNFDDIDLDGIPDMFPHLTSDQARRFARFVDTLYGDEVRKENIADWKNLSDDEFRTRLENQINYAKRCRDHDFPLWDAENGCLVDRHSARGEELYAVQLD